MIHTEERKMIREVYEYNTMTKVYEMIDKLKPDIHEINTRPNMETLKPIYVLECFFINKDKKNEKL